MLFSVHSPSPAYQDVKYPENKLFSMPGSCWFGVKIVGTISAPKGGKSAKSEEDLFSKDDSRKGKTFLLGK